MNKWWRRKTTHGVSLQWSKLTKERHSRTCLAQRERRRVFLRGRSLTKISPGLFFAVWMVPSKSAKFNHPRKFVPIRYITFSVVGRSPSAEILWPGYLTEGCIKKHPVHYSLSPASSKHVSTWSRVLRCSCSVEPVMRIIIDVYAYIMNTPQDSPHCPLEDEWATPNGNLL